MTVTDDGADDDDDGDDDDDDDGDDDGDVDGDGDGDDDDGDDDDDDDDDQDLFPSRARCRAAVHLARARRQAAVASARREEGAGNFSRACLRHLLPAALRHRQGQVRPQRGCHGSPRWPLS